MAAPAPDASTTAARAYKAEEAVRWRRERGGAAPVTGRQCTVAPSAGWIDNALLVASALLAVTTCARAADDPVAALAAGAHTPADPTVVLQKVPPAGDPAMRALAELRRRAAADPRDIRAADALARGYLDYGRRVGDARYAGYAEATIAPWLAPGDAPPALLLTQASILQYRHDFARARILLGRAVVLDPGLGQAWLTLASLDLVQGRPVDADRHCRRIGRQGSGALVAAVCGASVRTASGDAAGALVTLQKLDADDAPASQRAWIAGLIADAAEREGRWDVAEAAYRRGLAAVPGDNFLLVGYADLLLDRARPRDVVLLLSDAGDSDTCYLRLAIAHAVLRSPDAARYRWTMAARLAAYAQRGDATAGREEARFHLELGGDADAALEAARRNFEWQREASDVRLLLAAALAAGRPAAAAPALEFIAQTRLADPRLDALAARVRRAPATEAAP